MKRFVKLLLLASLVMFLAVSCESSAGGGSSGGSSGGGGSKSKTQTSKNGLITVTANDEGLLVHIDYSKADSSNWVNNSILVQDFPDENDEWMYQPIEAPVEVNGSGSSRYSEILFPFTKKNEVYRIWLVHMDANHGDWGETRESEVVKIKATGGLGEFTVGVDWEKTQYWSSLNDTKTADGVDTSPRIHLSRLFSVLPDGKTLKNFNPKWQVHAEIGTQWGDGPAVDRWLGYDGDVINLSPLETKNFTFKGKDKIFFQIKVAFSYNNQDYTQLVFDNSDRWFADCSSIAGDATHFPRISIKSTENDGSNDFVTEPIAKHVTEAQQSWGDYSNEGIPEPWYEKCDIYVNGKTNVFSGQVKVRGNWTTNYNKKSLRIKFDDKHDMFGITDGTAENDEKKFKNWILLAGFKDASLLRDVAALEMYKDFFGDAYYSSDTKLVELEVNGVYMGVYILAEQQEAKRMGLTEPAKKATNTDIGYLIEFDSYYYTEKELERFEIDYLGDIKDIKGNKLKDVQNGYTIKSDINGAEQHDFIAEYMNNVWKICYELVNNKRFFRFNNTYELEEYTAEVSNPDDEEEQKDCISAVIDVNSLADMYLFNEIICDPDLYLTSFFMDVDFAEADPGDPNPNVRKDHKLRFEAPWDFDSTMGNKRFCNQSDNFADASEIDELFAAQCQPDVNGDGGASYGNPWMVIFINSSWFKKLVAKRWALINQIPFDDVTPNPNNAAIDKIGYYSGPGYRPLYDFTRQLWGTPSYIEELSDPSREAADKSQADSADYLKQWLISRWTSVWATINTTYPNTNP